MQVEFQFRPQGPEVSKAELDQLTDYLVGRNWVRAAQIQADLRLDERRIRLIAEASDGRILSGPGCPGYKLLSQETPIREVDEAATRLESQGRRMLARATAIRRRAHTLLHT